MTTTKKFTLAALVAAAVQFSATHASASVYEQIDVNASYVYREWFQITGTGNWVFETRNLAPQGADTFMYLLNAQMVQIQKNDDCLDGLACPDPNPVASRIVYNKTTPNAEWVNLIVRAWGTFNAGTCEIWYTIPGQQPYRYKTTNFAGDTRQTALESGDVAQTVTLQNPYALDTTLYAFDAAANFVAFDDDGGVGLASRIPIPGITPIELLTVANFYDYNVGAQVNSRLVTNDAWNDADGDGLGNMLEHSLCTCDNYYDTVCGFLCVFGNGLYSLKDTDGDGIIDSEEVLGRDGDPNEPTDYPQLLPAWGANPRHKDVFVEVDWKAHNPDHALNTI